MKKNLKKILVGLVVVIVLAVIFLRGDQLEELVTTINGELPSSSSARLCSSWGNTSLKELLSSGASNRLGRASASKKG